jgi:hypothetical protein
MHNDTIGAEEAVTDVAAILRHAGHDQLAYDLQQRWIDLSDGIGNLDADPNRYAYRAKVLLASIWFKLVSEVTV